MFEKFVIDMCKTITDLLLQACVERHLILDSALELEDVYSLEFCFRIVEAGHFDGSVDGQGMLIGEGWIKYGYNEVSLMEVSYSPNVWIGNDKINIIKL